MENEQLIKLMEYIKKETKIEYFKKGFKPIKTDEEYRTNQTIHMIALGIVVKRYSKYGLIPMSLGQGDNVIDVKPKKMVNDVLDLIIKKPDGNIILVEVKGRQTNNGIGMLNKRAFEDYVKLCSKTRITGYIVWVRIDEITKVLMGIYHANVKKANFVKGWSTKDEKIMYHDKNYVVKLKYKKGIPGLPIKSQLSTWLGDI